MFFVSHVPFLASLYSRMEEWKKHRSTNWLKVSLLRGGADSWLSLGYCQAQQFSPRTMQGSSFTFPKPAIAICLCCLLRFFGLFLCFSTLDIICWPASLLSAAPFTVILLSSMPYWYYCFISHSAQQGNLSRGGFEENPHKHRFNFLASSTEGD